MSSDPSDKASPGPIPFEVFRSDGSSRLPGQRFPKSDAIDPNQRSGPVEQRAINDASGAPAKREIERSTTVLGRHDDAAPKPVHSSETAGVEPITIRLDTYRVDLAARIARVKAAQKEALDNLQQLEDDSRDQQSD